MTDVQVPTTVVAATTPIAPQGTVLVHAENVTKTYGQGALATPVLFGVSLTVRAGEFALLMGPSGSGKTTMISILAGLLRPTTGIVSLCGQTISEMHEAKIAQVRRKGLGFVFQTYNLFPALTALDNVAEVLVMKGYRRKQAREEAFDVLSRVGLADRVDFLPANMSGGQKQRVAIARAMAGRPALIIGDEPTAALDGRTALTVMDLLRKHVSHDTAVLVVTHDHRLERFADRIIAMEDGKVVKNEVFTPDLPTH